MLALKVSEYVGKELQLVNTGYVLVEEGSANAQRKAQIITLEELKERRDICISYPTEADTFEGRTYQQDPNWIESKTKGWGKQEGKGQSQGWNTPRDITRLFETVPIEERSF